MTAASGWSGTGLYADKSLLLSLPPDVCVRPCAVFKVKATLPFVLIPSLKKALTKAVLAPIILPKSLLLSMAFNHTELLGAAYSKSNSSAAVMVPSAAYSDDANITVTHPGDLAKLAFEDLSQAGEGVMRALVNGSINPLEVVTKGILNCNVTDIKRAVPEVGARTATQQNQSWV